MYIIKTGNASGTNKQTKSLPVCSYENPIHLYENTLALSDGGDELSQNTYQHTNNTRSIITIQNIHTPNSILLFRMQLKRTFSQLIKTFRNNRVQMYMNLTK